MRALHVVLAALLSACASWGQAGGLAGLEHFLSSVQSGDVAFTQTVTPANSKAPTQTLQGRMRFVRPNRFRFDYAKPFEQAIIADGRAVWLYDLDLQQVTVSDQQRTLATSPAGLLLSARDLQALRGVFALQDLPDAQGLQWMLAKPKQKDAALLEAKLAFDGQGLVRLEMVDAFGQRSAFRFAGVGMGQAVSAQAFQFSPPAQVDVIDQR